MDLRPYQRKAVDGVIQALRGHQSTVVVMPTGTGKTILFVNLARIAVDRGNSALILAHRKELVYQARDKLRKAVGLDAGIEMGKERSSGLEKVVIGTVQTISRRLSQFPFDRFSIVIVDECHHATAKQYRDILGHFASAKHVGVTATPDRADSRALGTVFESVAFEYGIKQAICDGWLCPIRQKTVHVEEMDLSNIRTVAGDFNQGQLEDELRRDQVLRSVAVPLIKEAGDRKTMVFAASVKHAHDLAEIIKTEADNEKIAVAMDGSTNSDIRGKKIRDFAKGEFQFLINCALFTEGFDEPSVSCVAMTRPTKSRALYTQMVGRGTRLSPGKEDLLVIDFSGNSGRHSLVSTLDILGGRDLDPDEMDEIRRLIEDGRTVTDAIEEAASSRARAILKTRVDYFTKHVDPFFNQLDLEAPSPDAVDGMPRASEKQINLIARYGLSRQSAEQLSKRDASKLIGRIFEKQLPTEKMKRALQRHGMATEGLTFSEASEMIARLKKKLAPHG